MTVLSHILKFILNIWNIDDCFQRLERLFTKWNYVRLFKSECTNLYKEYGTSGISELNFVCFIKFPIFWFHFLKIYLRDCSPYGLPRSLYWISKALVIIFNIKWAPSKWLMQYYTDERFNFLNLFKLMITSASDTYFRSSSLGRHLIYFGIGIAALLYLPF